MSTTIIGRIDEMGTRIDDLEKSIADLMQQVTVRIRHIKEKFYQVDANYIFYYPIFSCVIPLIGWNRCNRGR